MVRFMDDELIPTRTTLLARLKDWQDQSSWQDFFDTYWQLIYGVAVKGGLTETEAQEAVQETMISVARQMPSFKYDRKNGSFKAWLMNTTRWRIADQFRKRQHWGTSSASADGDAKEQPLDELIEQAAENVERVWEEEWEENLLAAAVTRVRRRLAPRRYQIFDFYVNKGWPPEKVAEAFGISVPQVYLAKHRVVTMIKREVERLREGMI